MRTTRLLLIGALSLGGCYAEAEPGYVSTTFAGPAHPELVDADGVQVIAGYNDPIFFADGFYWHNDGGRWYRARDYHRGWESARANVPARISRIQHPERYRNYRPSRARESRR